MGDWGHFLDEVSWFVEPGQAVAVGPQRLWDRGLAVGLPVLSALLESATLTPVSVGGNDYELLAWGAAGERRGWLCQPPPADHSGDRIATVHKVFWKACGGIVERFGEPDGWWLNQNEVLTVGAAAVRVADVLNFYAWQWKDHSLTYPIDPNDYYAVAVDANGNLTLANRDDGRLLLFAPDHAFTGVTPLAGCPLYSLLTIDDVPDLATWIEVCAARW